jgi:hypothetical protein
LCDVPEITHKIIGSRCEESAEAGDEAISLNDISMLNGMRLLRGVYPERTRRARNDVACRGQLCNELVSHDTSGRV